MVTTKNVASPRQPLPLRRVSAQAPPNSSEIGNANSSSSVTARDLSELDNKTTYEEDAEVPDIIVKELFEHSKRGRIGSGRTGSVRVRSHRFGSGRVAPVRFGSGRTGSVRVGSHRFGSGRVAPVRVEPIWVAPVYTDVA
ncbi:hypothetical protein ACJJTC_017317 [Scirpophaga incertulas]